MNTLSIIAAKPVTKIKLFVKKLRNAVRQAGLLRGVSLLALEYVPPLLIRKYDRFLLSKQIPPNALHEKTITVTAMTTLHQMKSIEETVRSTIIYSNPAEFVRSFNKGSTLWVCFYNNAFCGYCWSEKRPLKSAGAAPSSDIYLFDVEIIIPFRQKGVGKSFLTEVCTRLRKENSDATIWCAIHTCNRASKKLFRKAGFEVVE